MNTSVIHLESPYERGAWIDLVYHVFSFIETVLGDHSSLYSEGYRNWCRLHLSASLLTSCAESCQNLSAVYREAPRSHILQMLPVLWDSIGEFLVSASIPFKHIAWPSAYRRSIAEYLGGCLPEPLIEQCRHALRVVAEVGFEVEWGRLMAVKEVEFAKTLRIGIQDLSMRIPGLLEATWAISFPLGRNGRLVGCRHTPPWICVGVPDSLLKVDEVHPLMQGCHEFLVWRELNTCPDAGQADTVAGREGYTSFIQVERRALAEGRRILGKGQWKDAYLRWKATIRSV